MRKAREKKLLILFCSDVILDRFTNFSCFNLNEIYLKVGVEILIVFLDII